MAQALKPTEIITPPCRLSFPKLHEPGPVAKGSPVLKYQAGILIPAGADLKPFYAAMKAAMMEEWGKLVKVVGRSNPLHPCDEKSLDGYEAGWHFINAKSKFQPVMVDQRRQSVMDVQNTFYAGCWCRFHLNAYVWDHDQGGKGVSFGLNSIQFIRNDTRLDGRREGEEVFDEVAVEEGDEVFGGAAEGGEGDPFDGATSGDEEPPFEDQPAPRQQPQRQASQQPRGQQPQQSRGQQSQRQASQQPRGQQPQRGRGGDDASDFFG